MIEPRPVVPIAWLCKAYDLSEREIRRRLSAVGVRPYAKHPLRYDQETAVEALNANIEARTHPDDKPARKTKPAPKLVVRLDRNGKTPAERIATCARESALRSAGGHATGGGQ